MSMILLYQRGKRMTALFKDSKAFFFIPTPKNHHPPTIPSLSLSLSLLLTLSSSPVHGSPAAIVWICIWLTAHSCNLAFLFHSFHFSFPSFFLFPPTLATYFIAMFRGPSWPLLPVLLPTKAAVSVVCKCCVSGVALSLSVLYQYSHYIVPVPISENLEWQ